MSNPSEQSKTEELIDEFEPGAEEEEEPMDEPSTPSKPDAKVELKVSGNADAAQEAIQKLHQPETPPSPEEREDQLRREEDLEAEKRDRDIEKLLSDPKNIVVVRRTLPRKWNGVSVAGEVARYECPIEIDDIENDVFDRFGGKKFKLAIHAQTAGGKGRFIDAISIENPSIDEPWQDGQVVQDPSLPNPTGRPLTGGFQIAGDDPTLVPETDPLKIAQETLMDQIQTTKGRLALSQLNAQLKEMEEQTKGISSGNRKEGNSEKNTEIADLKQQLREQKDAIQKQAEKSDRDRQFDAINQKIDALGVTKQNGSDDGGTLAILGQMMKQMNDSNQTQMTAMMGMMTDIMKRPSSEEKFEDRIAQLTQMKQLFGENDSRSKKVDELITEIAMDKILGGGSGGSSEEEDPVKFAIKEMVPVLKGYIEGEQKTKGRALTEEEKQVIAQQVKNDVVARIESGTMQRPAPAPPPQTTPTPAPAPSTPAKETVLAEQRTDEIAIAPLDFSKAPPKKEATSPPPPPAPTSEGTPLEAPDVPSEHEHAAPVSEEPLPETGEEDQEEPPPAGPQSDAYDRKKSVDFILDNMLDEIEHQVPWNDPDGSFLPADCLNMLDEELLHSLLTVMSGQQLEVWLTPHADPELISEIKKAGKDEVVKNWVSRIITTVKHHYSDRLKNATTPTAGVSPEAPSPEQQTKAAEAPPPSEQGSEQF